jgi:hypothetical protein
VEADAYKQKLAEPSPSPVQILSILVHELTHTRNEIDKLMQLIYCTTSGGHFYFIDSPGEDYNTVVETLVRRLLSVWLV